MLKDKKNNNRQAPQFNRVNQKLLVQRLLDNVTSGEGASQSLYDHHGNVLHASNLINRYKEYRISRVEIDIPTPAVVYEPTRPRGQAQQEGDWGTFSVDPLNEGTSKPPEPPPAPPKANNRWAMPKTQREEQAESGAYEGWVSYVDETGAQQYYREQPAPEPEDGWKRFPQEGQSGAHQPQAPQPADQYAPPQRPYDDASPQFYGAPQEPYTPSNYQPEQQPYDPGYAGQQQYAADRAPAPDASRGSYDDYQQQQPDYGISQQQSSDRYPQAQQPPFEQTPPPQHSYRTEEEPQGKPYTMPAEPRKPGDPVKNPNEPSGKRTQSISARINQPGRKSGMHDLPPYWMVLNKQNQPSNEGQEEQGGQPQPPPEDFQQPEPPQHLQQQPPQHAADAFQQQQQPPQQRLQPQPPQNPADALQQQQQQQQPPQQRFQPQPPQNPADAFQQQQPQQFFQQPAPQQAADAFQPQQPGQSTQGSAENQQTQPVSGAQPPQSAAVPTEQQPSWFETVQDQSPPDQLTAWIPKEEPPWLPPERELAPWEKLAAKPSTALPSEPAAPPEPQMTEPAPVDPAPQSADLWDAVESAQPAVDNPTPEPPPPPEEPSAPKDVAPWLPRAKRAKKPTGMPLAPPAAMPQPPRKPYQISEKTPSLGLPKAPQGPNIEQPAAFQAPQEPNPAQQTDHEADAPWLKLANDDQYKYAQHAPHAPHAAFGEPPPPQDTPETADELQRTPEEESKRAKRKTIIEERSAIEGWLTNLRKDPPRRTTGTFRKPTLDGLMPPPPFLEKAPVEGDTLESNKPAASAQQAPFSQPAVPPAPAQTDIPMPAPQAPSPAAHAEEPTHFNDPTPGMPLLEGITVDAPIMPKPVPVDEATITNRRKPRQKGTADGLTREISKPAASGAKPRRKVQRSERGTIEMVIDRRGKQVTPHYNKVGVLNSVDLGDGTKFVRAPGGKTWSLVAVDTNEILMEQLQSVVFDKDGNLFYTTSDGQKHMVFAIES